MEGSSTEASSSVGISVDFATQLSWLTGACGVLLPKPLLYDSLFLPSTGLNLHVSGKIPQSMIEKQMWMRCPVP